jgi:hypothetical protein
MARMKTPVHHRSDAIVASVPDYPQMLAPKEWIKETRIMNESSVQVNAQSSQVATPPPVVATLPTVRESLPSCWDAIEFGHTPAWKLRDMRVVKKYGHGRNEDWKPWPGKHRNVLNWIVLEDGRAIGWNEGPQGWSFPVIPHRRQFFAETMEKRQRLDEHCPGWRTAKHENGMPQFSIDGTMMTAEGNRSIFDDLDC